MKKFFAVVIKFMITWNSIITITWISEEDDSKWKHGLSSISMESQWENWEKNGLSGWNHWPKKMNKKQKHRKMEQRRKSSIMKLLEDETKFFTWFFSFFFKIISFVLNSFDKKIERFLFELYFLKKFRYQKLIYEWIVIIFKPIIS